MVIGHGCLPASDWNWHEKSVFCFIDSWKFPRGHGLLLSFTNEETEHHFSGIHRALVAEPAIVSFIKK